MSVGCLAVKGGSIRSRSGARRYLRRGLSCPGIRLALVHEFRTSLTVVKGFIEVLLASGDALSPEQRRSILKMIQVNAGDLHALGENLIMGVSPQPPGTSLTGRRHSGHGVCWCVQACWLSRNASGGTTLAIRLSRGGAFIVPEAEGTCH